MQVLQYAHLKSICIYILRYYHKKKDRQILKNNNLIYIRQIGGIIKGRHGFVLLRAEQIIKVVYGVK